MSKQNLQFLKIYEKNNCFAFDSTIDNYPYN